MDYNPGEILVPTFLLCFEGTSFYKVRKSTFHNLKKNLLLMKTVQASVMVA